MPELKLSLLGSPRVELDERQLEIKPRKVLALLIYLACKKAGLKALGAVEEFYK